MARRPDQLIGSTARSLRNAARGLQRSHHVDVAQDALRDFLNQVAEVQRRAQQTDGWTVEALVRVLRRQSDAVVFAALDQVGYNRRISIVFRSPSAVPLAASLTFLGTLDLALLGLFKSLEATQETISGLVTDYQRILGYDFGAMADLRDRFNSLPDRFDDVDSAWTSVLEAALDTYNELLGQAAEEKHQLEGQVEEFLKLAESFQTDRDSLVARAIEGVADLARSVQRFVNRAIAHLDQAKEHYIGETIKLLERL